MLKVQTVSGRWNHAVGGRPAPLVAVVAIGCASPAKSVRCLEVRQPLKESVTWLIGIGFAVSPKFQGVETAVAMSPMLADPQESGSSNVPFLLGFETVKTREVGNVR